MRDLFCASPTHPKEHVLAPIALSEAVNCMCIACIVHTMIDIAALRAAASCEDIAVKRQTQISAKVTAVTAKLKDAKRTILILSAQARNANKLISIVEISKRQLQGQVYQYTALSSETTEIEQRVPSIPGHDSDDSEKVFVPIEIEPVFMKKQRAVPVLTVYLSNYSVKELRQEYWYVCKVVVRS